MLSLLPPALSNVYHCFDTLWSFSGSRGTATEPMKSALVISSTSSQTQSSSHVVPSGPVGRGTSKTSLYDGSSVFFWHVDTALRCVPATENLRGNQCRFD